MTKLGKTEQRMLAEAARHDGRFCAQHGREGKHTFGSRDIAAANKLVARGMAVRIDSNEHYLYGRPGQGIIGRCYSHVFKVI